MGRLGKEKSAERKAKKRNEHMERMSTSAVTNKPLKSAQRLNSTKKLSTLTNLQRKAQGTGIESKGRLKKVINGVSAKDGDTGVKTKKESKGKVLSLPVDDSKKELLRSVRKHKTTIVVGETGSGKSTRIPSFLQQGLVGRDGGAMRVVCTQPRRVAATSIAERVAQELDCAVGENVGYTVRFDDCSSRTTRIKYVTDGILLRESMRDPALSDYDVVVLDEAHERSLQTDVVMGLLHSLQKQRKDLRLVIMSATLDVDIFASHFEDCNTVVVKGRTYPVDVLYVPERESDWQEAALLTCLQVHEDEEPGGVLVFLPGQEDIESLMEQLCRVLPSVPGKGPRPDMTGPDGAEVEDFEVVPLYARMPPEEQRKAFKSPKRGVRKFVLATNIAETSVTISGIKYVVDPGLHKTKTLVTASKTGMELLATSAISQSQAKQRAGRAGRQSAGKCFRLYTEATYEQLSPQSIPEIERVNLGQVCLQLMYQGIMDPMGFPFLTRPNPVALRSAVEELTKLGALRITCEPWVLLPHGRHMADLPLTPLFANLLLRADKFGCMKEMLTVVSMLSADSIFVQPTGDELRMRRDNAVRAFFDTSGDFTILVKVYNDWVKNQRDKAWCMQHFLNAKAMRTAESVRDQLTSILQRSRFDTDATCLGADGGSWDALLRCLADGLQNQVARRVSPFDTGGQELKMRGEGGAHAYKVEGSSEIVYVHPSSPMHRALALDYQRRQRLQGKQGRGGAETAAQDRAFEWCVFAEIVETKKKYIKNLAMITEDMR